MQFCLISSLFLFISFEALAVDYDCSSPNYKMKLTLEHKYTSLIVQDRQSNEYLWQGNIQEWIPDRDFTTLSFDTHDWHDLELTFDVEKLAMISPTLKGFARGWTGRGFIHWTIHCTRSW